MKKRQLAALLFAAAMAFNMTGCQTETEQAEQLTSVAEDAAETEKPERKPIPEGGWTYETLSECVWIDGKYVSFPLDVSDFSSDFTFEPYYTSDDKTIIDVEVYHKEEYVGSARIVDESGRAENIFVDVQLSRRWGSFLGGKTKKLRFV